LNVGGVRLVGNLLALILVVVVLMGRKGIPWWYVGKPPIQFIGISIEPLVGL
jgi:hypothetical protein